MTVANTPPTLSTPTITPSDAEETDDLTITYSLSDEDQDSLTTEIRWYLDGVLITEFNDASTIPAIATRDGDEWRVEVTVSDGDDTVSRSSQIITVGGITQVNNPPEISTMSISPSQPVTTEDLQLIYSAQDQENDAILDAEIEWRVDGLLTGFDTSTLDAVETAKGQVWEAVSYTHLTLPTISSV